MLKKKDILLDIWACMYILIVMLLSAYGFSFNAYGLILLFALAIPFVIVPEYYVCISLFLSSVSYYFYGAYEGISSIYTILFIIIIINILLFKRLKMNNYKGIILSALFCLLAIFSYRMSPFHYDAGLLRIIYIVIMPIFVGNFINLDLNKLIRIIPKIACAMVLGYFMVISISGSYVNGRLTISESVNTNTFGKSCAIIVTSLFLSYYYNRKNKLYLFMCISMIIIEFLSGSRGALLAIVGAIVLTIILNSDKRKEYLINIFKVMLVCVFLFGVFKVSTKLLNIDTSRFDIHLTIDSGGNNRTHIYSAILSFILQKGYWKYGYGPGHDCTRKVLIRLISRDYMHAHNTFIEAFGEMGIFGLLMTIAFYIIAFIQVKKSVHTNKNAAILLGLLLCILINGMVESYFCYITMWLILAICRNNYNCSE